MYIFSSFTYLGVINLSFNNFVYAKETYESCFLLLCAVNKLKYIRGNNYFQVAHCYLVFIIMCIIHMNSSYFVPVLLSVIPREKLRLLFFVKLNKSKPHNFTECFSGITLLYKGLVGYKEV